MDQTDATYYNHLAVRYFRGELDYEGEKELFRFVKASSENGKQFRQWEEEWLSSPQLSPMVDEEWKRMKLRMSLHSAKGGSGNRLLLWGRMAAAVVAGLIFLMAGFMGVYYYQVQKSADNLFTLETGRAEKTRMLLADGTTVYLNAGSTLRYAGDYNNGRREVRLTGEAYFEVTRQEDDAPFVVKTDYYDVVVKGTKFNVCAYPEDTKVSTALLDGSVDIIYKERYIPVNPGELVSLDKASLRFSKEKVQAEQYKSWTEGRFEYDKISLQELVDRLSRRYDVTIHLDEAIRKDMVFRISLRNEETIDEILQAFVQIAPIRYEKKDRDVYLWRK